MKKVLFAAAVALGALSGTAMAADLIVDEPAVEAPAAAGAGWYLQLLGGATIPNGYDYDDETFDIDSGWAIAGVLGAGLGVEGLSAELDLYLSQSGYYDGFNDYTLTTGSVMADLKYTVSLNDTVGLYGAVGLGGVYLKDVIDSGSDPDIEGWGAGYLLKAGVTVAVADNISLVGEARYANSFSPIETDGDEGQHGSGAVLVGLQIGF